MINNKLSHLEIELLEKTREFVRDLNDKNPEKNNQYRKAYFIKTSENPERNRTKIRIMQHHALKNTPVSSLLYWNNANGEGKLCFSTNYMMEEYINITEQYKNFILENVAEMKNRLK
jgi:hypothetical protein